MQKYKLFSEHSECRNIQDQIPAALLSLSFLLLITFGTIILSLPEMTTSPNISILDALFTSTSASCVTGLIVHDTADFFTMRGQVAIMILIQLGPWEAVNKTYAIIIISLSILFGFTLLLTLTEHQFSLKEIIFETFSAFGTVGLSTGITSELSDAGKILITILMYIGRLGSLTLGIALSRRVKYKNYKYPTAHFMVG